MFSTILDKITGYFDRRNVISALLPSFVFWMLIVVMFVTLQMSWSSVIGTWDKLSITIQFLLLLAFFTWITFWSFLTLNFRTAILHVYEGYWPNEKPFDLLVKWRRDHWSKRWDTLNRRDQELKSQEETLVNENAAYEDLRASLNSQQRPCLKSPSMQGFAQKVGSLLSSPRRLFGQTRLFRQSPQQTSVQQTMDDAQAEHKLDRFLADLKEKLEQLNGTQRLPVPRSGSIFTQVRKELNPSNDTFATSLSITKTLHTLGKETREWWGRSSSWREEARQNNNSSWVELHKRLGELTAQLEDLVDQHLQEVRVLRQPLYRDLSLYYPSRPSVIMPTQLGNVMKAAELYSWERYQLDAVLIWPRLQSSLPDAFSTPLQDAKTSLDLMTTLSTFILLFGLPLALWTATKAIAFFPWWIPFVMAFIVLPLRRYIQFGLTVVALTLPLAILYPSPLLVLLQTFIIILVGVVFLSWLCYQNAVQATLDYGEKLKAAFDLYRWKVLEGLHLQLPKNFEEERHIWREVGSLLAHNNPPKSSYYRYVQSERYYEISSDAKKEDI